MYSYIYGQTAYLWLNNDNKGGLAKIYSTTCIYVNDPTNSCFSKYIFAPVIFFSVAALNLVKNGFGIFLIPQILCHEVS